VLCLTKFPEPSRAGQVSGIVGDFIQFLHRLRLGTFGTKYSNAPRVPKVRGDETRTLHPLYRLIHERRSDRLRELNIALAFFGTVTDVLHCLGAKMCPADNCLIY
jgi:hypothetical protein